jgi:hypothetical protein
MNIKELVASYEADIAKAKADANQIATNARAERRANLTLMESARVDELMATIERIKPKLVQARAVADEEAGYLSHKDERYPTGAGTTRSSVSTFREDGTEVMHLGQEEHVYDSRAPRKATEEKFLEDILKSFMGDPTATDNLMRHQRQYDTDHPGYSERAAGDAKVADFGGPTGGLVVPEFLTELLQQTPAAGRPFADSLTSRPLPDRGMVVHFPTVTTSTSAAIQAAELNAVSATSIAVTDQSCPVVTFAGQQQLSLQSAQRGLITEECTVASLVQAKNAALDLALIQTGTYGLAAKAGAAHTYVDASPTAAELYPIIVAAAGGIETVMMNRAKPSHILLSPYRFYWLAQSMTTSWPFISSGAPSMSGGSIDPNSRYGDADRGHLPLGLHTVVDANVPLNVGGNQDYAIVYAADDLLFFEDPNKVNLIRAEQASAPNLGLLLVVYSFAAYYFGRVAHDAELIGGTGMLVS